MTTLPRTTTDLARFTPITHDDGMALFAQELQRNLVLMRTLTPHEWQTQTECPDWDVRRMYLHVLGACESGASYRELVHQMQAARRYQRQHGGPQEAALSATQVAERLHLSPDELITRMASVAPRVVRTRTRMPSFMRRARLSVDGPVVEKWSLGYLVDVIYLRDAWMHRVDVSRAIGRDLALDAEHDGRIVADVVAEWGRRHGQPFTLVLTGPAGGTFRSAQGSAGPELTLDAVEFCRILGGRAPATHDLLSTIVPF
jgi:uncharacterized protein (TIGR03083 family)